MANRNTKQVSYGGQLCLLWALLASLCIGGSQGAPDASAHAAAVAQSPSVTKAITESPSVSQAIEAAAAAVLENIDTSKIDEKTIILAIANETVTPTSTTTTTPAPVKSITIEEHADGSVVSIVSHRLGHKHSGIGINVTDKLHKFDLFIDPVCEQLTKLSHKQLNRVYQQLRQFSAHTGNNHLAKCFTEHSFKFDLGQQFVMNRDQLAEFCSARASNLESFRLFSTCAAQVWSPAIETELDAILKDRITTTTSNKSSTKDSLSSVERSLIDDIVAHLHDEQVQEIASELALEQRQLAEAAAATSTSTSTSTTTTAPTHKSIGKLNQTQENRTVELLVMGSSQLPTSAPHQQLQATATEHLVVGGGAHVLAPASSLASAVTATSVPDSAQHSLAPASNLSELSHSSISAAADAASVSTAANHLVATRPTAQSFAINSDHFLPHINYEQQMQQQQVWQTTQSPVLIVAQDQPAVQHESNIVSTGFQQQQQQQQQQQAASSFNQHSSDLISQPIGSNLHVNEASNLRTDSYQLSQPNLSHDVSTAATATGTSQIGLPAYNVAPISSSVDISSSSHLQQQPEQPALISPAQSPMTNQPIVPAVVTTPPAPTTETPIDHYSNVATAATNVLSPITPTVDRTIELLSPILSPNAGGSHVAAAASASSGELTTPAPFISSSLGHPTPSPLADFLLNSINFITSRAPTPALIPQASIQSTPINPAWTGSPPIHLGSDTALGAGSSAGSAAQSGYVPGIAAGVQTGDAVGAGSTLGTGAGATLGTGIPAYGTAGAATGSVTEVGVGSSSAGSSANALASAGASTGAIDSVQHHESLASHPLLVTPQPTVAAQGFIPAPPLAMAAVEQPTVAPMWPMDHPPIEAASSSHQDATAQAHASTATGSHSNYVTPSKSGVTLEPTVLKNIDTALAILAHQNSTKNGTITLSNGPNSITTTTLIVESTTETNTTPAPTVLHLVNGTTANSTEKPSYMSTIESVNHTVEIGTLGGSTKKSISHEAKMVSSSNSNKDKNFRPYVHEVIVVGEHVDGDDLVNDHEDHSEHHHQHEEHEDHADSYELHGTYEHHGEHHDEEHMEHKSIFSDTRRREGSHKKAQSHSDEMEDDRIMSSSLRHHEDRNEEEEEEHEDKHHERRGRHEGRISGRGRSRAPSSSDDHSDHEHLLEGLLAGDVIHVDAGELDKSGD